MSIFNAENPDKCGRCRQFTPCGCDEQALREQEAHYAEMEKAHAEEMAEMEREHYRQMEAEYKGG